jgi:2-methylisocitrate lyase-like PEP mutase family enzyme
LKCGHFTGKHVISTAEMVGKIQAATDARGDSNFQIVARTDAAAVHGIEDAIDQGHRFIEAGADILFIEAMEGVSDIERLPGLFSVPWLINIVIGGSKPRLTRATRLRPRALRKRRASRGRARHAKGARPAAFERSTR